MADKENLKNKNMLRRPRLSSNKGIKQYDHRTIFTLTTITIYDTHKKITDTFKFSNLVPLIFFQNLSNKIPFRNRHPTTVIRPLHCNLTATLACKQYFTVILLKIRYQTDIYEENKRKNWLSKSWTRARRVPYHLY